MGTKLIMSLFVFLVIQSTVSAAPNVQKDSIDNKKSLSDIGSNPKVVISKNMEQQQSPEAQKILLSNEQPVSAEEKTESPVIPVNSETEDADSKVGPSLASNRIKNIIEKQRELDEKQEQINGDRRVIEALKIKLKTTLKELNNNQTKLNKKKMDLLTIKAQLEEKKKKLDADREVLIAKLAECREAREEFEDKEDFQQSLQNDFDETQAILDLEQKEYYKKQILLNSNAKQVEADEQKLNQLQIELDQQQKELVSELKKLDNKMKETVFETKTIGSK